MGVFKKIKKFQSWLEEKSFYFDFCRESHFWEGKQEKALKWQQQPPLFHLRIEGHIACTPSTEILSCEAYFGTWMSGCLMDSRNPCDFTLSLNNSRRKHAPSGIKI